MERLPGISIPLDMFSVKKQQAAEKGKPADDQKSISEINDVAKEMESLFAFQLLKVMRETSQSMSDEKKGYGSDTYMAMFDMEISKLMSERGLGLHDVIAEQIGRMKLRSAEEPSDL